MSKNSYRGLFVAFEGNDGAGKSTIAKEVFDILQQYNENVIFLDKNHPLMQSGYSMYHMAKIRDILWDYDISAPLHELGDTHWLLLLAAWFAALDSNVIQPALRDNKMIVSDGWYYKYLARFVLKNKYDNDFIRQLFYLCRQPDHVIFLDSKPELTYLRKNIVKPSESGQLENNIYYNFMSYQKEVRSIYEFFFANNWSIINSDAITADEVIRKSILIIKRNS